MKRLLLHPEVDSEVEESADYYESRREGYGEKFRAAVEESLEFIRSQPKASSMYKRGTVRRRIVSKPFRYGIYYVERDEAIFVLAVMNQRRELDYWMDRLKYLQ